MTTQAPQGTIDVPVMITVRVAVMGAQTASVDAPSGLTVREALNQAGVSIERDHAVTLNGNPVNDLDQAIDASPGTTPVIVVAPKVSNG